MKIFRFCFRYCITIGLYVSLIHPAIGQVKDITIASPNAAALGKFVDIPVNYHTGVPDISIPVYTVKQGPLTMPISLAYHAGGLRVAEQASWVGAGWSLNAGGVVTRSPRGGIDERAAVDKSYLKDKGYYNYLYDISGVLAYSDFANGYRDGEPDLFTFNFNGNSGKFYFRADKTAVLIPQQDIRIKPLYCDGVSGCSPTNEYLFGWIITTPDGVQYYFGKTTNVTTDVDPAERTESWSFVSGASFSESFSSWYLYKVVSPDGNSTITLAYTKEDYGFYSLATYPLEAGASGNSTGMDAIKNRVQGVRLNSITFSNGGISNGTISFIPETTPREDLSSYTSAPQLLDNANVNAKSLKRIEISTNTICTAFEMSYSYFVDNTTSQPSFFSAAGTITSDRKRLKLNSVQEKSCDNTLAKPAYLFTYYDEASVPRTLSLAVDHWGYYNGAISNTTLIPPVSTNGGYYATEGGAADRESKWPQMRAGTLQSVRYPTGGTVDFTYKNHSVFIEKILKVSDWSESRNATNGGTSTKYLFTVTTATYFQLRKALTAVPDPGLGGNIYIDCTTNSANSYFTSMSIAGPESTLIILQPGNYEFYVRSNDGTSYKPIEATLTKYNNYQQYEEVVVGGLRVESTSVNDGVSASPLVTNYSYVSDAGVAQGVLYSRPNYIALARNNRLKESGVNGSPPTASPNGCYVVGGQSAYFISPGSIHPMTTSQGNHVGYNQVKVSNSGGGYSIYQYTTAQNSPGDVSIKSIDKMQCDPLAPNYPPAPEPHNFLRGTLRRSAVYNASNVLLKETFYDAEFTNEAIGVNGLIVKLVASGVGMATEYELKTSKKTKSTEVELTYDPADPNKQPFGVVREIIFNSPNHAMPVKEITYELTNWNSTTKMATRGIVLNETRKSYVADVILTPTVSPCNVSYSCDQTLITAMNQYWSTYTAAKTGCGSNTTCIFNAWQTYTLDVNSARDVYVNCRYNYYTCLNNSITDPNLYTSAGTDLKALIDLKLQNQISPVIETSFWRDGKFMGSSFITYQMFGGRNYIFPGKMDVIQTPVPQVATDFVPFTNTNTTVTRDVDYKLEANYSFNGGNIAEIMGKNGVRTSYLWGYNNSEPVALVQNAKQNQIFYNSFETAGGTTGVAKSGSKYLASSTYVIPFTPPADGITYKMSYWYWSGGAWNFSGELPFSTSISNGTQLDEIRVYPSGALMTTYTYDLGKGVSTISDPNGVSTHYEYDVLGRLEVERDDAKKIKSNYGYYYKVGGN